MTTSATLVATSAAAAASTTDSEKQERRPSWRLRMESGERTRVSPLLLPINQGLVLRIEVIPVTQTVYEKYLVLTLRKEEEEEEEIKYIWGNIPGAVSDYRFNYLRGYKENI